MFNPKTRKRVNASVDVREFYEPNIGKYGKLLKNLRQACGPRISYGKHILIYKLKLTIDSVYMY